MKAPTCRICLENPPDITIMAIPRHGEAQLVDDFLLAGHWCYHIYSYHATLELDGVPYEIHPGSASLIPPGVRMVYRYRGPSEHVYFHFREPEPGRMTEVPMILNLESHYAAMDQRAKAAVGHSSFSESYPKAALWALLHETAALTNPNHPGNTGVGHPIVDRAMTHIEQNLAHPITVAQLCQEVGVSYGYLGRLFKTHLDKGVLDYVRERRIEQAAHLISSTTLPIKVIARAVGIPDLSQFNRHMRREKSISPRALRALSQGIELIDEA